MRRKVVVSNLQDSLIEEKGIRGEFRGLLRRERKLWGPIYRTP